MVFRGLIRADVIWSEVFQLRRNNDMSMRTIGKACGISWSSVRRILRRRIQLNFSDRKKPGCSLKLSVRQCLLVWNIKKLRENNLSFYLLDLMKDSSVSARDVSEWTVNRFLQPQGFHYLQTRKKGLMKKTRSVQVHDILQCDANNLFRRLLDMESGILLGWGIVRFQKKSIGSSDSS